MTRARGSKDRRRENSRSLKCDAVNGRGGKKPKSHTSIVNGTSSVSNGYKISDGSMANTESSFSASSRVPTQATPSSSTANVSSKARPDEAAQAPSQLAQTRTSSDAEQEGKKS